MTTKKKQYHHGNLNAELLARAPELIVELGLDGFTLRELARRIGVSHASVYRHFADKRELLASLSIAGHRLFAEHLKGCVQQELNSTLKEMALGYLRWAHENPGHYRVMFGPRLNEDGKFAELESAIEETLQSVNEVFREAGFNQERSRDLSVGMMIQLHGYTELARLRRIRVSNDEIAERYLVDVIAPFIAGVMLEVEALA